MDHVRGLTGVDSGDHGLRLYRKGCRCGVCREGNAANVRAHRARKALGLAGLRSARLPPGERIGDSHGALRDYIRGCRCGECREANREAARRRRERVGPRLFKGKPVIIAEGWRVFGSFELEGVTWVFSLRDEKPPVWSQVKIAAGGAVERKANYWLKWNGERIAKGRESWLLQESRPELAAEVLRSLQALH
jgi:hypothetical protein